METIKKYISREIEYDEKNLKKKKTLIDFISGKTQNIVLLADAGMGKSIELKNISEELKKINSEYNVCGPFDLCNYTDESIDEFIDFNKKNDTVLIFDGYDELLSDKISVFKRKLNTFISKNKEQIRNIVISSRTNFYSYSKQDSMINGSLDGFIEVKLLPITQIQINSIIEIEFGNNNNFMELIYKNKLQDITRIPFYLLNLIQIYKKENQIPSKAKLFNKLIEYNFTKDINKFNNVEEFQNQEFKIEKPLQKIAFSLQLLNQEFILNEDCHELLSTDEIKYINYSGIWSKDKSNSWKFIHALFREYLASEYMLDLKLEEIKKLIKYEEVPDMINLKWVNVLGFLFESDRYLYKNDLIEWILELDSVVLTNFDFDFLSDDKKSELLIKILENCKEKNLRIHLYELNIDKLCQYCSTKKVLDYLINELKNYQSINVLNNTLKILENFKLFYGEEEILRTILFGFCKNDNFDNYTKYSIILTLSNCKLFSNEVEKNIIKIFKDSKDSYIRAAIYKLIEKYSLQNKYLYILIDGIKNIDYRSPHFLADELFLLNNCICKIDNDEAIIQILKFFIENGMDYMIREEDILESLFSNLKKTCKENTEKIFCGICDCFEFDTYISNYFLSYIKDFLLSIGRLFDFYEYLLGKSLLLEYINIMDTQCIDDFIYKYKRDNVKFKSLFESYARRVLNFEDDYYKKQEIIELANLKKESVEQKNNIQDYFDSIFDKEKYLELVKELIEDIMPDGKLISNWYNILKNKPGYYMFFDLQIGRFETKNIFELEFKNGILNWENFSMELISQKLKNHKEIKVSEKQKEKIITFCKKEVNNIDFEKYFIMQKNLEDRTDLIRTLLSLSEKFDIKYDSETYIKMLSIPISEFGKSLNYENVFPDYLTKNLNGEDIKKVVLSKLEQKTLKGEIAIQYVFFAVKNKLKEGLELAISLWNDSEFEDHRKEYLLEYIIEFTDENFLYEDILKKANDNQLKIMTRNQKIIEQKDFRFLERLKKANLDSDDKLNFLKELILFDSLYGIEIYYKLALEKNKIPNYNSTSAIFYITEQIKYVKEKECLDLILKLVELLNSDSFKDEQSFGLYQSLCISIRTIANENSAIEVKHRLEQLILANNKNNDLKTFCNYNIENLKQIIHSQYNKSYTILEVKELLQLKNSKINITVYNGNLNIENSNIGYKNQITKGDK